MLKERSVRLISAGLSFALIFTIMLVFVGCKGKRSGGHHDEK